VSLAVAATLHASFFNVQQGLAFDFLYIHATHPFFQSSSLRTGQFNQAPSLLTNHYMNTVPQVTFVQLAFSCANMLKTFNNYVSYLIINEYQIREFRLPFLKGDRATRRLLGEINQNQGG